MSSQSIPDGPAIMLTAWCVTFLREIERPYTDPPIMTFRTLEFSRHVLEIGYMYIGSSMVITV